MLRLLLICWLLLIAPQHASAHAVLLAMSPADGERVDNVPQAAVLTFNEPVLPVSLRLLDSEGAVVAGPDGVSADESEVRLLLPPDLPRGRYLLSYRVTSVDSHPVSGSIGFGIGMDVDVGASLSNMEAALGWQIVAPVVHLAGAVGLLTAAGLALFAGSVAERDVNGLRVILRRRRHQAAWLGIVASAIGVATQGGLLGDMPLAALITLEPWKLGVASTTGRSAVLAVLGGALLLPQSTPLRTLAGTALIVASFAATGHAAAAPPRWAAMPAVMLHVAGVAFWLGSLIALEAQLGMGPLRRIAATVRRFTRLAIPVVIVLLLAGLTIAALQIRSPAVLLTDSYTQLLAVKLALVAALLGFALYNNRILTPRLSRGDGTAAPVLRRSVRVEIVLVALVLAVTVTMGRTPPPRATALQPAAPPSIGLVIPSRGRLAFIELTLAGNGSYDISASLLSSDAQPIAADAVTLRLANPAQGIEPISRTLSAQAPGTFATDAAQPLIPGRWSLRLDARIGDFDVFIFETEALIR